MWKRRSRSGPMVEIPGFVGHGRQRASALAISRCEGQQPFSELISIERIPPVAQRYLALPEPLFVVAVRLDIPRPVPLACLGDGGG